MEHELSKESELQKAFDRYGLDSEVKTKNASG